MDLYLFLIGFMSCSSLRNAYFLWAKLVQEYRTVNVVFRADIWKRPHDEQETSFSGVMQM